MTKLIFSNSDLVQLKRDLKNNSNPNPSLWEPLICRLKCAEAFVPKNTKGLTISEYKKILAWRKSKGDTK